MGPESAQCRMTSDNRLDLTARALPRGNEPGNTESPFGCLGSMGNKLTGEFDQGIHSFLDLPAVQGVVCGNTSLQEGEQRPGRCPGATHLLVVATIGVVPQP